MRVLVIGGTGFIGSPVVRQLGSEGHAVAVFHRGASQRHVPAGTASIVGDRNELSLYSSQLLEFRPDVIVDMAAMTRQHASTFVETFGRWRGRIVLISSGDVYWIRDRLFKAVEGDVVRGALTEQSPLRETLFPYRAYAHDAEDLEYDYDKILVEQEFLQSGIPTTVLRLPMVYGPGDGQHRVWEYLRKMEDGRAIIPITALHAEWRCTRAYVENVASAIASVATTPCDSSAVFNVGGAALTEIEWMENIGAAARWRGEIRVLREGALASEPDLDWTQPLVMNSEKLRQRFGYGEHVPLEVGLRRTIAWERMHAPRSDSRDEYATEDAALATLEDHL